MARTSSPRRLVRFAVGAVTVVAGLIAPATGLTESPAHTPPSPLTNLAHIDWLGAKSGSVAALGGAEIYKALGAQSNISYHSNVSDGTHCANRSEWTAPLQQSIQAFLKGSGSGPGVINISSKKAGNLADWRTWTTPTLS